LRGRAARKRHKKSKRFQPQFNKFVLPHSPLPHCIVQLGGTSYTALVDSGCTHSVISSDIVQRHGLDTEEVDTHGEAINGTTITIDRVLAKDAAHLGIGKTTY
jgi:hypothetical protein